MRRAFWILVVAILIPAFGSCIFAPKKAPPDPDPVEGGSYLPLDKRNNLLHNLELAYKQRVIEEYTKLLDNSGAFIFYFGQDDLSQGIVTSSQWGVGADLASTEALFDRNPPQGEPRADDVVLDLIYTDDEDDWFPFVPETHPDETWYTRTVEYSLSVRVGLTTYTQNKQVFAKFTARFTEVDGDSLWQIVTWHDDI
jgi:hypothetical protein